MAGKRLVRRHSGVVRLTHWINVLALALLLMSGLQIFNAHSALYWGSKSTFDRPWLSIRAAERGGEPVGLTQVAGRTFDTTGVLGWSGKPGAQSARAFPAWATVPSWRDLAAGRRWHFFLAWVFVLNGLVYLGAGLLGGHVRRDLLPRRAELGPRGLWRAVVDHARLRPPRRSGYNVLQKLAYLTVVFILLPLMPATGLAMSPALNAAAPWLPELFGGRQSARTVHFICAGLIVFFVAVHVAMVAATGPWNNIRAMITGRYAVDDEGEAP